MKGGRRHEAEEKHKWRAK